MTPMHSARPCTVCETEKKNGVTAWHCICPRCGYESGALEPSINDTAVHELIDEDARERSLKALRQENFKHIVDWLDKHTGPEQRALLDVGSAHGWFLEEAGKKFSAKGIEPDDVVREKSLGKGIAVRGGYFPDALAPEEKFDVIVFNDVIEHIPNVGTAFQAIRERLNSNGLLVLNLPSSRGFFYQLSKLFAKLGWSAPFDRLWQKGLPSPHVHYFAPDNLSMLASKHGLQQVEVFELPALRTDGLLERLRYVKNVHPAISYVQYLMLLLAIPVLKIFPSDIVVGIYKKN
jgi:SAM-dependent methyltransferase